MCTTVGGFHSGWSTRLSQGVLNKNLNGINGGPGLKPKVEGPPAARYHGCCEGVVAFRFSESLPRRIGAPRPETQVDPQDG